MSDKIIPKNKYNAIPEDLPGKGIQQMTQVIQVGIVVRDLDKTMAEMKRIFGVEPDAINNCSTPLNGTYKGEPADFTLRICFYSFANIEFEFMQPIGGKSIWQDHLDKNQAGLHHVRFNVQDYKGIVEEMEEKGIGIYQDGLVRLDPRYRWTYLDTEPSLGFVIELLSLADSE